MRHSFVVIRRFLVAVPVLASAAVVAVGTPGCQAPQTGSGPAESVAGDTAGDPEARGGLGDLIPDAEDFAGLVAVNIFPSQDESDTVATAAEVDASAAEAEADAAPETDVTIVADEAPAGIPVSIDLGDGAVDGMETVSLEAIAGQLHRLAAVAEDPIPFELVSAMLLMAADDPDALASLPIASEVEGQLMADEIETRDAFADFARAVGSRANEGEALRDVLVAELTSLTDRLRNGPDLRIGDADICEAIRGFGDVDRLPHRLSARIDREVFVYVPLEGLDWTEDTATGRHRWQIRHRIELHQLSDGLVIDPGSWSNLDHALPQPTRDTYFWIRFTIPGRDLASGRYALKVRVEEPSTGRQAERTIEIDLLPERLVSRE